MRRGLLPAGVQAAALVVGSLFAAPSAIADAPHTRISTDGAAVTLALYEAECDDNPEECMIADIGCPSRGEFTATVFGLEAREAGLWLAMDEKAYLTLGAERIPLWTRRIENSEMSGDWDVSLSKLEDAAKIWRAMAELGRCR